MVVGLLSLRMLIIGAADVLFVLLALEVLDTGASGAALLNAALGAGAIVGGAITFGFVGRSRLAIVAAGGAIAWGVTLVLANALGSAMLAMLLIVIGSAGLAIMDVAGRTILQRSIRDEVLARVFGLQEGLAMAALAAGAILVPILTAGGRPDRRRPRVRRAPAGRGRPVMASAHGAGPADRRAPFARSRCSARRRSSPRCRPRHSRPSRGAPSG